MKEYISKDEIIEHFEKRVRYTVGEDSSKERYRYMQWLTDYNSIISIPAVKANPLDRVEQMRTEIETEKVGYPPSADYYKAIMKVLEIIDKYRQEG